MSEVDGQSEDPTDDAHTDGDIGDDSAGSDGATAGSDDEEKGSQEAKKEKQETNEKDADDLRINDTGFTIKIDVPGIEPFDLPVSILFGKQ